jgi:hypothetical protein
MLLCSRWCSQSICECTLAASATLAAEASISACAAASWPFSSAICAPGSSASQNGESLDSPMHSCGGWQLLRLSACRTFLHVCHALGESPGQGLRQTATRLLMLDEHLLDNRHCCSAAPGCGRLAEARPCARRPLRAPPLVHSPAAPEGFPAPHRELANHHVKAIVVPAPLAQCWIHSR